MVNIYKRYVDNIDLFKDLTAYGQLDTPVIKKELDVDLEADVIPFNFALAAKANAKHVGVHFFLDDYQFERIWKRPGSYIRTFQKFKYILSPDFSLYTDYPKAYQHFNHWRKHALAAFYQAKGVKVIPSLSWSDESSFRWCFDGIERGSVVAVSSVGSMNDKRAKEIFIKGFKKAIEILEPFKIIYLGILPDELNEYENLIVYKSSYQEKFRERDVI